MPLNFIRDDQATYGIYWSAKNRSLIQQKPPARTAISHKINVTELIISPAFAKLDLSLNIAAIETANITGGPNTIRIPARIPNGEPHPKPGTLRSCSTCSTIEIQGDNASQKLIFPNTDAFI
ncbi:MAG: hypothetical protein JW715_07250 [Sedimentisphaerales bacterium]|nr:hypothetical protein [Sedimentisphaerales bacterium]